MIVVCDTSPLNYLVLIDRVEILPALFGTVVAPPAVMSEMGRSRAPAVVHAWVSQPPDWLEIRTPTEFAEFTGLGPGESEAIALAIELRANVLLIDERDGTAVARNLGLFVTGTLGVLVMASRRGLLTLSESIADLRRTTFRCPEEIIAELLREDRQSD